MTTTGPANGTLIIHGGGNVNGDQEFLTMFKQLVGEGTGEIIYIPTAAEQVNLSSPVTPARVFGLPATILHARHRAIANAPFFVEHIQKANAVFISGGRQPLLAEAYLHTQTQRELGHLLERGGVIAGSSAGATIMGSFMVRNQGSPYYDPTDIVDWDYETEGFGFIKNIAIDQHIRKRVRESDLRDKLLPFRPELLGVGIDEYTAIVVRGNEFEVIGKGSVFIHDGVSPYFTINRGQRYDLQARRIIH